VSDAAARRPDDVGAAHRAVGWNLYGVSRYADALRESQRALANDPHDAEAHRLRALALSMLRRHVEARKAVAAALALDPQSEWSHRIRAHVLINAGSPRSARSSANESIRLRPNDAEGYSLLAEVQLMLDENEAALASARHALSIDPNHIGSLVRATFAAEGTGRIEEALDFARRAVACRPLDAAAHRALGIAAFRAGDRAVAKEALRESVRLDPQNETARAELLRTLRSRSLAYRVIDDVKRKFYGPDAKRVGVVLGAAWAAGVVAVSAGGVAGGIVFSIVSAAFVLPLWIVPLNDLIVLRDPFGRLLLERWEKVAAVFTAATLVVALALLAGFGVTRRAAWGWFAAGFAALGMYGIVLRRMRTRGAVWRVGGATVVLSGLLVASAVTYVFSADDAAEFGLLFPLLLFFALVFQKPMLGKKPARR
jgi:Flp pilus assembly protein TadD